MGWTSYHTTRYRKMLYKAKRRNWQNLRQEEWWVEGYPNPCVIVGKWHICKIEDNLSTSQIEIDPTTLCQCTGLTDDNYKWIWENDIISTPYCRFVVTFRDGVFGDRDGTPMLRSIFGEGGVVIGNIFDNPELVPE